MRREERTPRDNWRSKVEQLGLTFHTVDGEPYWNESAAYVFDSHEITVIEDATNELHAMCLKAVDYVLENQLLGTMGIPDIAHSVIATAWEEDPPAIYGRFDLAYSGDGLPKLLEYNADTPTSLLEAAVIQWHWLQEVSPEQDQFNSIWEGLVQKWQDLGREGYLPSRQVHFGCMDSAEDLMTTAVLMDTAREAGLTVDLLNMSQIGWDSLNNCFVDAKQRDIQTLFKLYPWEWMIAEPFGQHALRTYSSVQWIEPIWKMVLSNKAILAILWELYPQHPLLLPASLTTPEGMAEYVRKPLLGREGANVTLHTSEGEVSRTGPYDEGKFIYQAYTPLPSFNGNHAVIGSWVIDGSARGIGIRESNSPITDDLARFVPHYFNPESKEAR